MNEPIQKNENSRVFITHEVRPGRKITIDYTPAKEFGQLKSITLIDFSRDEGAISNDVLIEEIRAKLHDFDAENDFIVISGSPAVSFVVAMILRERAHRVNLLRWSNETKSYSPLVINLI